MDFPGAYELASSTSRCIYQVFLSFRGEDTRKNFTDHLYIALLQANIHTFRDDDRIERGEDIQQEINKAIQQSKISIIVFSKDYASSRWCLDELVTIMERRRRAHHIVLPVFYHVDPTHVREQTGSYGDAFDEHQTNFQQDMERVKRWRAALQECADLGGMVLQDWYEAQFVQKIVQKVKDKLNCPTLHACYYPVGIDSRIKDINFWLQDRSASVGIAMIYGIAGVGKTTVAKIVYNQNLDKFDGSSFLASVREIAKETNGLVHLQRQLLSDILKERANKIYNVDEGMIKIKNAICCRRVLIVFDDMDELDQFNAIIGMQDWICQGSKIIVTTRMERLFKAHESCMKFKVNPLDVDESLELFSWHAFGQAYPSEYRMGLSKSIVKYCDGIPLALEVFGTYLSTIREKHWESALRELEEHPHDKIQKILKISYDSLRNDGYKNLFLDIACFFAGMDKDYVITILNGYGNGIVLDAEFVIQSLIDRHLVTVNEQNMIMMHQLIRDMGREIVYQESCSEPGRRSRLWHQKDVFAVLREETGTNSVKGLAYTSVKNERGRIYETEFSCGDHDNNLAFQSPRKFSKRHHFGMFPSRPENRISKNSTNEEVLKTRAFVMMNRLKLLQLNHVRLDGDYADFPKGLIWLSWHGFPLRSIPDDFRLEELVVLDMRNSSLVNVWKGFKFLGKLEVLSISHSYALTKTPDLSGVANLEKLILKDCINLAEIDESIGKLKRLVLLNLRNCSSLRKLPRNIGLLASLKQLVLSGCSKLHIDGTTTTQKRTLPPWLSLGIYTKPLTLSLPIAVFPGSLVELNLRNCNVSDDVIPNVLKLRLLERLDLSENPIQSLPESIQHLTSLRKLWLYGCERIQSLPKLPVSLELLWLNDCKSLRGVELCILPPSLVELHLRNCNISIDDIPNDFGTKLPFLEILDLCDNPLDSLPESIRTHTRLKNLWLAGCERLQSVPALPSSLENLYLCNCKLLERPGLSANIQTIKQGVGAGGHGNLVQVENMVKLQQITNEDIEMIRTNGLFNLESKETFEVEMLYCFSGTRKKLPLQILHECGIFSIFHPGSQVPNWYDFQAEGYSLSFVVPSLSDYKICGLNLCVVYGFHFPPHMQSMRSNSPGEYFPIHGGATIHNVTKSIQQNYEPSFIGVPKRGLQMLWLSHWRFMDQLESGDRVEVNVRRFLTKNFITSCGIHLVYDKNGRTIQATSVSDQTPRDRKV